MTYKLDRNISGVEDKRAVGIWPLWVAGLGKVGRSHKGGRNPELADVMLALVLLVEEPDIDVLALGFLGDVDEGAEHKEGAGVFGGVGYVLDLLELVLWVASREVGKGHRKDSVNTLEGSFEALNVLG